MQAIFGAVEKGSKVKSPFLHFSWNFVEARNWHMRGRVLRGEGESWMARVAVSDLEELAAETLKQAASSQGAAASSPAAVVGTILDISTAAGQWKAFGIHASDPRVADRAVSLGISVKQKEVLVPWRGCLPAALFERIDADIGLPVGGTYSTVQYNIKWGRRVAEWRTSCEGKALESLTGAPMRRSHASVKLFHVFSAHPSARRPFGCSPTFFLYYIQ